MKVFIDTSAFCALTIPKDLHNAKAKSLHQQLKEQKAIFYTSDYVLDEVYTLLKTRSNHATAVNFMDRITTSRINLLRVNPEIDELSKAIFKKFEDKRLSFTDCTSFALINHFALDAVFAFDDHFRYHPYSQPIEFWG